MFATLCLPLIVELLFIVFMNFIISYISLSGSFFLLYLLTMKNAPFHLVPEKRSLIEDSVITYSSLTVERWKCHVDDVTKFTLQELKRQSAVPGILKIGTCLDILSTAFRQSNRTEFQSSLFEEVLNPFSTDGSKLRKVEARLVSPYQALTTFQADEDRKKMKPHVEGFFCANTGVRM
ncbi:uncharacterized protein [Euphorbia lathyris]|uniref:uncharacterized protein isoform X2 n=1 Tax=Euphorbia lathyris TaxID=212925 RepID=UPI0033136D56